MTQSTHLTDAIAEVVCGQVAMGRSLALAGAEAGFSREAVKKWQRQGNADLAAGVESVQARFVTRLAQARGQLSDMLTQRALRGLDAPAKESNVRDVLSVLKTFLPSYYGERAADLDAAAEAAADAPAASEAPADPGAVTVELCRCPACGSDQLPGKRYCGDCRGEMPTSEAK